MSGKRSNISSLDGKILKFLFFTKNQEEFHSYIKKHREHFASIRKYKQQDPKSTGRIKVQFNESGGIIWNLNRLKEFGLIKSTEVRKGSRKDNYWHITDAGRYCTLALLENRFELKKFIQGSVKRHDLSPSPLITKSSWESDNVILFNMMSDREWDSINELVDRVKNYVSKYRYKTIMPIVNRWFLEFYGKIPSNLKSPLKIPLKQAS